MRTHSSTSCVATGSRRRPGRIVVAPALTPRGGVECDLTVTCLTPDRYYVVGAAAAEAHDLEWLQRHVRTEADVTINNVTQSRGVLTLAGPRSRDVLSTLTNADLSNTAFPWLTAQTITIAGVDALAMRVSYVGELGWELHLSIDDLPRVYDALIKAGAPHGIVDFGYRALDSLRMEKGYRLWGSDMNAEFTPFEAGLTGFVKLDKGDFIGRQALVDQRQAGLTRQLVTLVVDCADAIPLGNESIQSGAEVVGYVSAAEHGHVVHEVLAHAYLPVGLSAPGTTVEVDVLGEWCSAEVVTTPRLDPDNVRPRQ